MCGCQPRPSTLERLSERSSAGTPFTCVGVIDGEPLLFDGVSEVDGGTVKVGNTHFVNNNLNTVVVTQCVAVEEAFVEVELVDESGAATGLHGDTQSKVSIPERTFENTSMKLPMPSR